MNETNIFQANSPHTHPSADGKKPSFVPALVLGILAIVLGLLIALVGEILSIIGIILSVVKRKDHNTKAALICSIVGLVVSVANHIIGIWLLTQM